MTNIPRYTQTGLFRRLEKYNNGELCYFFNVEEEFNKLKNENNFLTVENLRLFDKNKYDTDCLIKTMNDERDKLDKSKLLTKKYSVIGFVSMVVNIGLLAYIWMS